MYTPTSFRVSDDVAREFVAAHGFGLLVTTADGEIHTTHTPMFLSEDGASLFGHVAKANPQWRDWSVGCPVRAVFHGPHAYVSPSDYASDFNVPTWNYTSVAIDGTIEVLPQRDDCLRVLEVLARKYESGRDVPWTFDTNDDRLLALLDQIVAFRVTVESMTGKFKLNQNKSVEDRVRVAERLRARGNVADVAVADLVQRTLDES